MTKKTLDPREARVRRMVTDRSTWPGRVLCMKRIVDGRIMDGDFGVICNDWSPFVIQSYPHEGNHTWTYQTVDDLIAAGWVID